MTTCLGKSCSFGLLYVCFDNFYLFFVCSSFPFGFADRMQGSIYAIMQTVTGQVLLH